MLKAKITVKKYSRIPGYYTTIESCLKGILKTITREYISREEENSIYELQKEIKRANEFLEKLKLNI
jgi:hypothetical protein